MFEVHFILIKAVIELLQRKITLNNTLNQREFPHACATQ